jgi:hypothetical protein
MWNTLLLKKPSALTIDTGGLGRLQNNRYAKGLLRRIQKNSGFRKKVL